MSGFDAAVAIVAVLAGAVASIAGFGVGSLLTPLLATAYDPKLAVAFVAVPHGVATFLRLWRLRDAIAWRVLGSFGVTSAAGGLAGAFIFAQAGGSSLLRVLGVLLIVVGLAEMLGVAARFELRGPAAWIAGGLSGMFGGMVGNQGGLRSAGLLAFDLSPRAFVATAAAIALIVDIVRLPIYLWTLGGNVLMEPGRLALATAGVVAGTFAGSHVLLKLPVAAFRRVIGAVLLALGVWLLR